MKKTIVLALALSLMLLGCGGAPAETTAPATQAPTTQAPTTQAPATQPTTVPPTTVPPTTVPPATVPAPVDINPLTGEALDKVNNQRPFAIMLNNHHVALPHQGVAAADVIYETCVEGDITRMMAIFTDPAKAGAIGSVRSCRPPFVDLVGAYDAIYSSAAGDTSVLNVIYNLGLDYINGLMSSYFYRDNWRMENMGFEHSLMIDGADLVNAAKDDGIRLERKDQPEYGFRFDETLPFGGEPATEIELEFIYGGKETDLEYDAEKGVYFLEQFGMDYIDANTQALVPFRNVLILETERWIKSNGIHVQMETTGEGTGYYARDGKIIPIQWSRESEDAPFVYTAQDGTPVNFGVGKTYVAIIENGSEVEYS